MRHGLSFGIPRGYEWPDVPLYHATAAADAILSQGFRTRNQLAEMSGGRQRHLVGGGTAHAISMTLDDRVAKAAALGLSVIAGIVQGRISLGELIIAGSVQAPTGTKDVIRSYQLTEERILRYDQGLRPFYTRLVLGGDTAFPWYVEQYGATVESALRSHPDRNYGREVDTIPDGATDMTVFIIEEHVATAPPERLPISISGWAPKENVELVSRYPDIENTRNNGDLVEMYKRMLALSSGPLEPAEVYDPLFFLTDLSNLREMEPEQFAVVAADCEASWICARVYDAKRLGLTGVSEHIYPDWYHCCEGRLEDLAAKRTPSSCPTGKDMDQPSPRDTVLYLGRAMAEVRVFDPSLLTHVRYVTNAVEIAERLSPDGGLVIAYPWFHPEG